MRRVTLLLSGVPQYVTLRHLSFNLHLLFNTDEIEMFKIRDLPNHPQTNKRQIALDFRSDYDAIAAQEKLEGYTYELENGREYTLHATINKSEEYMCSESPEYGGSSWYGDDWTTLAMIPNVSDADMYRAHARLDAQLELLKKQKLVLEKEKELLYERQRLKRKYGSLYAAPTRGQYVEGPVQQTCDSETEVTLPKRSRSTSLDRNSKRPRSRSREIRPLRSRRSRSKDSGYILPQIEWYDERIKTRELPSHSGEDSRSHRYSRDGRSSSRELREYRYPVSRYRDPRSRSNERPRHRRSPSKERGVRARSRSQERNVDSRESRSRERRSHSRERLYSRRSRSLDRIPWRRSRSRERARESKSDWVHRDRSLRSPDRRTTQLAIMPRSPRGSPNEWSVDSSKAVTPTDIKHKTDITNKELLIKVEKNAKNSTNGDTKENRSENTKIKQDNEKKKVDKYNSKIKKAEKTALRIQALSKDIMVVVAIVVDEIMDKDKIRISASDKVALIKTLEALVHERLEPIARVKKDDDNEVLKKYKMQHPMEGDLKTIKQMLDEIPKLEMKEPEATVTVSSESVTTDKNDVIDVEVFDVDSDPTEQQYTTNNVTPLDVTLKESSDDAPKIKTETNDEPIIILDIDSAEIPVPRYPQFFLVIKNLVKNMKKVVRTNKLGEEIKLVELKHVLRHILRKMLKGQGVLPREEIIRKFREIYPIENDEQFIRNTIKDIRDGKYPRLTGHVGDTPENDCGDDDDVVLVEKKYEVVTVTDSDDDAEEIRPKIEFINLDYAPTHSNLGQGSSRQAMPISSTTQAISSQSNAHVMSDPVNAYEGSSNSGQEPKPASAAQANTDLAKPGQALTGITKASDNLGEANIHAANINQTIIGRSNTSQIVESSNFAEVKIGAVRGRDMPDLGSPGQVKTGLDNPIQEQISIFNHVQADTCLDKCVVNAIEAKKGSDNPSQAQKSPANISRAKSGPGNPVKTKAGPVNGKAEKGPDNTSEAKKGPVNITQTKSGACNPVKPKTGPVNAKVKNGPDNISGAKKGSVNITQTKSGAGNPVKHKTGPINSKAKKGPDDTSKANKGSVNITQTKSGAGNPVKARTGPVNAKAKKGPDNTSEDKNGSVNITQNQERLFNPGQAKTDLFSYQTDIASNNTMSMKEKEKRASLDQTIRNLESKGIQETPENNKTNQPNHTEDKVNRNTNNEEKDNLKVTAITIVTSLNELIAKSTAKGPENDVSTEEIKKEVDFEVDAELDDSSLNLDNVPRVTSITIMTSDAELFSLGNEDRKEVNEIKNETDIYYDAEDNLVNDIQRTLDEVNFGNIQSKSIEQNNVNSEQVRSVNNADQFSSVNSTEQFSTVNFTEQLSTVNSTEQFSTVNSTEQLSTMKSTEQFSIVNSTEQLSETQCDSRPLQDDEETIESIVKYVASMY